MLILANSVPMHKRNTIKLTYSNDSIKLLIVYDLIYILKINIFEG